MEEPLQKTLERYDVLDRIAVGGMAEVFLAKAYGAHGFEKTLAIKRILPELARDPEFEARFIAEAKVSVKLSHANVVQVLDFGRIGESLFIAMEYVDGLDLAALLRRYKDEGRLLPLPAGFHIAIEIVRALDYAHQHNVVHRDISPSNILISRAGEVKIADFGIAVAAAPHRASSAGPRKVMGKWRYMSPEQTRGDTLDTRSDLFSAASVMYELFTGDKLFPGDEAEQIIKNIHDMPIPKASPLRSGIPSRLDDILAGMLARKPIDRPSRPATVLRSLIELSYESSIMATALDVAEALATVLPAKRISGTQQLDDVIRKQLGDAQERSVARRTAVTDNRPPGTQTAAEERGEVSTGLFRKVEIDGISRLEELDPADTSPPSSPDSGLHRLLSSQVADPDRRTVVGGPPTGAVPKTDPAELDATPPPRVPTTKTGTTAPGAAPAERRPRALIAGLGALAVLGGGVAVWAIARGGARTAPIVAPAHDAAAPRVEQFLDLDSVPSGATLTIDGKPAGTGPARVPVAANVKLHVAIALPAYQTYVTDVTVDPGARVVLRPSLMPAPAHLHVVTVPPGAEVTLAGQVLGDTPLDSELPAQRGAELALAKAGFDPVRLSVDLTAGATTNVKRELVAAVRYGVIQLQIPPGKGAGVVYLGKRRVGRAPSPALRLPVGRQVLHIVNDAGARRIEWDVTCVVDASAVNVCKTRMP